MNTDSNTVSSGPQRRQFASDNYSGICPEAWESMQVANQGHAPGYGDDEWTQRAADLLRELFEIDCEVFFTFNGTAANALALSSLCQSYHSIICHQLAHVETDECGAPEFFSNGSKILLAGGEHGKILPNEISRLVKKRSDLHYPKPRVVSLTQATEMGTVYSVSDLQSIHEMAKRHSLKIHMDGARFANAVAALDVAPKEVTWKVGVDVLCFGGTKNGMAVGDAIVFFSRDLADEFAWRCKQAGQLASKMRFLSAPWVGMLQSGAWLNNARRANEQAARLETALSQNPNVEFLAKRQVNSVFLNFSPTTAQELRNRGWQFYTFIGAEGARLMCTWDTTDDDVDSLAADITDIMRG